MTMTDLEPAWIAVEGAVRGFLRRRLRGDNATADDLTQEVFLRLRRSLDDLRDDAALGSWVMRIARSVLIDHLRRRAPTATIADIDPCAPEVTGEDNPGDLALLGTWLRGQLEALPAHEAAALRLTDLDGLTMNEAATRLGIGLPALKQRVRRGRARLRVALDACCAVILDGRGRPTDCEPRQGCPACPPQSTTGAQP
jgi:RNA polymerase sigma-70 factor (ECF subfamily)